MIINGIVTVIKFGIRNNDKYITLNISICTKFVSANNLVICSSQEIDKKIKNTNKHDFNI